MNSTLLYCIGYSREADIEECYSLQEQTVMNSVGNPAFSQIIGFRKPLSTKKDNESRIRYVPVAWSDYFRN